MRQFRCSSEAASPVCRLAAWLAAVAFLPAVGQAEPPDKSGVKPSVLSLPRGAGSIEGLGESFQPQLNTGGATYGVSIQVPPGRAGLAPAIRLAYNSFSGNGLAGIGWSLEFMSVKRQTSSDLIVWIVLSLAKLVAVGAPALLSIGKVSRSYWA